MNIQMMLLLLVMAVAWIYGYNGSLRRSRGKLGCVVAITLILTCFSGLRTWWMGDLIKYYTLFRNCNGPEWQSYVYDDWINSGIRIFFHFIGSLGLGYQVAIFLIAAFSAIALGVVVYRYSPSPFWSYLMWLSMGFYFFTYSGLKQTIAMAFLMLALVGLLENRFWRFLSMTLLGALFHAPAMIFLIAYPFSRMKFNRMYLIVIFSLVALVFVFRSLIVNFMSQLYYDETEEIANSTGVGGRFLMMAFILFISIVLRPLKKGDMIYNKVFNLMVLALALQIFSVFSNNYTRLADYYYQFVVLFMPLMLQNSANKTYVKTIPGQSRRAFTFNARSYTMLYGAILVFALYYYNSLIVNDYAILPNFRFFWEIDAYALYGA